VNAELLRIVDAIHRDKEIDKDIVFTGIEQALIAAAHKFYGEEADVVVKVDRSSGSISATHSGEVIDADSLGRISAQMAKQIIIQKIREAERDRVFDDFINEKSSIVSGVVQRQEGGVVTVNLGKVEAILPRSEQLPGEAYQSGARIRALLLDVRKNGQRVKLVLSRAHPDFIRRLFEQEIPEVNEGIIEIRSIAREAGHRTKVAVASIDSKVDCVGACVGVRGSRIKNIIDELGGERIDIVRWNDSLQIMIPNALQPAAIEEVFLYQRLGRAIVLVQEDQLSLAIGRRGQNVRLASKLVGWDIEIMTHDEYNDGIDRAVNWFNALPGMTPEMVEALIVEGFLSYTDLTFLDAPGLMEIIPVDEETGDEMIACAEEWAEEAEEQARQAEAEAQRAREAEKTRLFSLGQEAEGAGEVKPTVESVFGRDEPSTEPVEMPLTAAQVFGEAPKPSSEPDTK